MPTTIIPASEVEVGDVIAEGTVSAAYPRAAGHYTLTVEGRDDDGYVEVVDLVLHGTDRIRVER